MMGIEPMFSQQLFGHDLGTLTLTNENGNIIGSGDLSEKMSFNYVGANYLLRLFDSKKKNCWLFSIGLGYISYKDRMFFDNYENTKITATTLSTNMSIGYDIGLSKKMALGFKASLMSGTFSNYKQTTNGITTNKTMPDKTAEGLGTIKLSIGLRFNK